MFVDDQWNIVGVIDFEFAPVQPQQMVEVPHWLSDKSLDELVGPDLDEYQRLHDEFIDILEQEETRTAQGHAFSKRMREDWRTGRIWYNAALRSPNGFPIVFENNLQARFFNKFEASEEASTLARLWGEDYEDFIAKKLVDKAEYEKRVREIFAAAKAAPDKPERSDT